MELHLEAVAARRGEHGLDADEGRRARPEPVCRADLGAAALVEGQNGSLEGTGKIPVRKLEDVAYSVPDQLGARLEWDLRADKLVRQ